MEKTKPNKHKGSFTRSGRGLSSQGGRDDAGGATAEKASKKKENEEKLILKYLDTWRLKDLETSLESHCFF